MLKLFLIALALQITQASGDPAPPADRARNVIVFLADGVGPTFHTAARLHASQTRADGSAAYRLSFEDFPHSAFVRTWAIDDYVTDSAASATAILSGVKTVNGAVGVTADYSANRCDDPKANPATLGELAAESGRATGVISTSYLVDASPAAFFAHTPQRGWFMDDRVPEAYRENGCRGVVEQLMGSDVDVALGGGRIVFAGEDWRDPYSGDTGLRTDGRNLFEQWEGGERARVVYDREGLVAIDPGNTERLLGVFAPRALFGGNADPGSPTLAEMTLAALDILARHEDGYVLFVEEEGTDEHQHAGQLNRAFESYLAFDAAIAAVLSRVDLSETLIIVTSDHGQSLAMAGPAATGEPVLGLATRRENGALVPAEAEDEMGFPVLGFYAGPQPDGGRAEPAKQDMSALEYVWPSAIPTRAVPHSGVDVGVFATGPGAPQVKGMMDQHRLFDVMIAALGIERAADPDSG